MPAVTELTPLAKIARKAGEKIREMQQHVVDDHTEENPIRETKEDESIVTIADHEAHRIIKEAVAIEFPGMAFLSEEGTPEEIAAALKHRIRIETDPLDNTTGYAFRNKETGMLQDGYSVNIGIIRDGAPVEGAVYFPSKEEMYFTGGDGNAYRQKGDGPINKISVKCGGLLRDPLEVVTGFSSNPKLDHLESATIKTTARPAQYRTMGVADGTFDVSAFNVGHTGGFNTYDVAGPDAILRAAGGAMVDRKGDPLHYGTETYKVPDHVAGSNDALIALKLSTREQLQGKGQQIA